MNNRPRSVTVISWVFMVFGGIALLTSLLPPFGAAAAQHVAELKAHPFEHALSNISRILAVLCGAFMLYGFNWARWLLVVWVGSHIIIGALHSPWSTLVHGLLFAVVAYFLFRPRASAYFRGSRAEPTP